MVGDREGAQETRRTRDIDRILAKLKGLWLSRRSESLASLLVEISPKGAKNFRKTGDAELDAAIHRAFMSKRKS